jgi:hypothetical protein
MNADFEQEGTEETEGGEFLTRMDTNKGNFLHEFREFSRMTDEPVQIGGLDRSGDL